MTVLPVRGQPYLVPSYSVTGDILSFSKCGLQYRYLNGSSLPPSRPVQMWFGEFIHSVLELATRIFQGGQFGPLPWDAAQINDQICDPVVARLAAEGKTPRSRAAEDNARLRALVAINALGPQLFPLVEAAEVSVSGTRKMPATSQFRAEYFEITGRIDLVTSFRLDDHPPGTNRIVDSIRGAITNAASAHPFEVLVDYKGTRRPSTSSDEWQLYERQLQTYAWLRQRQPDSLPVAAGFVVFVNELLPTVSDMTKLGADITQGATDVLPQINSDDQRIVLGTRHGNSPFGLSWPFRLARALKVVTVERPDQNEALLRFDSIVEDIESSVQQERSSGSIQQSWTPRPVEETCVACDFQTICPRSPYLGPALAPLGRRTPDDF